MKKLALGLSVAASLISTLANAHAHKTDHWDSYQHLAKEIAASVDSAPIAELAKKSAELTTLSTKLLPAFVVKQPICKDYLGAALAAANDMMTLSLDEIERDYHADGKLPAVKSAACYHAKDLLVHPATMAVIAKTAEDSKDTREQIEHELEEVLEHFSQVKQAAGL
ncbi:hypothetical protein [Thalassotalea euphylliae]|uniref:Uncharacterized protein n=1 Tax=Thalassotalea euphylliae TaxID=1655234 RepID=A0A3E0UI27_9GAMM|nr:hypothetical protein [Thalassotalea euphylliae]REL36267.1 hypothetical protein DXX92_13585 [Thalassotalea euphylliae]